MPPHVLTEDICGFLDIFTHEVLIINIKWMDCQKKKTCLTDRPNHVNSSSLRIRPEQNRLKL